MGNKPSSNPYGLYSATAVENYNLQRLKQQKWKLVKPWFGKPQFEWVGYGPAEPCGSCSDFGICADYGVQGCARYETTKRIFEGPVCNGQDTTCPLSAGQRGGKKRKQSKKTRKGSRR